MDPSVTLASQTCPGNELLSLRVIRQASILLGLAMSLSWVSNVDYSYRRAYHYYNQKGDLLSLAILGFVDAP